MQEYNLELVAQMFEMELEELHDMSVSEVCEYMIKVDDEEIIYCLISDGYQSFDLITDNEHEQYSIRLGGEVMAVPAGTYQEVFAAINGVRNGEFSTVH
jgi:hypothetical protein